MVYEGKTRYRGRRRSGRSHPPSGRRKTGQDTGYNVSGKLAASLWILFLAVALRVLFPQQVESVKQSVLEAMAGDVDYKAAIAVMGEAVRGERGFGDAISAACEHAFSGRVSDVDAMGEAKDEDTLDTSADANMDTDDAATADTEPSGDAVEDDLALPENVSAAAVDIGIEGVVPVDGTVTSSFGMREHPVDGEPRFHYGTDLGAQMGSDVVSFAGGTVYASGDSTSYGLYLIVDHGDGVQTMYAHLSEILVSQGETVKLGQVIGKVGDTGNATDPCLHFELTKDGVYLDPEYYI